MHVASEASSAKQSLHGVFSKILQPFGRPRNGGLVKPVQRSQSIPSPGDAPSPYARRSAPAFLPHASPLTVDMPTASDSLVGQTLDMGYCKGLEQDYELTNELGSGGNATVRLAKHRLSGEQFACKSIAKVPAADASDKKKEGHIDSIRREVDVLRRLRGSLNVVRLADVYEDDTHVHVLMECCSGGELWHAIGARHYSERTIASYMRAVLRTLAQCHSHHILHRDVKPGNFMLLNGDDRAPLKAIDFGLAAPFDPECLPRTDLGLEGTPWYMAPEVLSSRVSPASDLWSAGVMAYQLLTGHFPFDDRRNPVAPSISAIWRSVLVDDPDFTKPYWDGISGEAKAFVKMLLNRDPDKRPSAKEALQHPWLRGNSAERSTGSQLNVSVVQRIQRFAQSSNFKRTVLQLIAEELLTQVPSALSVGDLIATADAAVDGQVAAGGWHSGDRLGSSGSSGSIGSSDTLQPASPVQQVARQLASIDAGDRLDRDRVEVALRGAGYKLQPTEVDRLIEQLDLSTNGRKNRAAFAASQIDWKHIQTAHVELWLDIAQRAFSRLDADADGLVHVGEVLGCLRRKLPEAELRLAVRQTLEEAGEDGKYCQGYVCHTDALDLKGFLKLLRAGSVDSLDQYDDRWGSCSPSSSVDRLNALLDSSHHGSDHSGHSRRGYSNADISMHSTHSRDGSNRGASSQGVLPPIKEGEPLKRSALGATAGTAGGSGRQTSAPITIRAAGSSGSSSGGTSPSAAKRIESTPSFVSRPVSTPVPVAGSTGERLQQRGGGYFDKRMHGASLYHNAVLPSSMGPKGRSVLAPTSR